MLRVDHFKDPLDLMTFGAVVTLYEGTHSIAPNLHYALSGIGLQHVFIVRDVEMNGTVIAAGILNTPEAGFPIGEGINPVAWVVGDMITHPNCRRRGAARLLLDHMETVATRNGGRILYLYTENDNTPAMRLYEKAGFRRLRDQGDQAVYAKLVE